jgi:hypothetical protein
MAGGGFPLRRSSARGGSVRPRRISVYGATDETLALVAALARRTDLEVGAVFDPEARVLGRRLALAEPATGGLLQRVLTDDPRALGDDALLSLVIDGGALVPFAGRFPAAVGRGVESLSPEAARVRLALEPRPWRDATANTSGEPGSGMRWEALCEAGLRVLALSEPGAIARATAAAARHLVGAEHAVVRIRDGDRGRYAVRAYDGPATGRPRSDLLALDVVAARAALRRGAAVAAADLQAERAPALLALPLVGAGRPLGTLALYGGGAGAGRFAAEDRALLERLAAFAAHALERTGAPAGMPEPVCPATADPVAERLAAALASAGTGPVALLSCRISPPPGGGEGDAAPGPALERAAEALQRRLRAGDVLGPAASGVLHAIVRDFAEPPAERVARLARAVAESVAKATPEDDAERPSLVFGYAVRPEDGETAPALLARAARPRIRLL